MKKFLAIVLLMAGTAVSTFSQDVITKKNGDEIRAKVVEIGSTDVKYKRFGNETGPTYTLSKSEIFMIKYENGDKDMFNETVKKTNATDESKGVPVKATRSNQAVTTPTTTKAAAKPATAAAAPTTGATAIPIYPERKGFVGVSLGAAIPVGNIKEWFNTGFHMSFDFGYLFSQNVGIYATAFGNVYSIKDGYTLSGYSDASVNCSGFFVGPLFTAPVSETGKVEFDFKPLLGLVQEHISIESASASGDSQFGFGFGASLRFNLTSRFSLSGNLDYVNAKFDNDDDLSSIGIYIGAAYRF
jgi:opacity protein-like surface antigen